MTNTDYRILDCGHTDENYVWPSEHLSEVCYDCFSAEADDAWWAMMVGLSEFVEADGEGG